MRMSKQAQETSMPTLRPMTQTEFAAWRDAVIPAYAADKVASGQWSPEESLELSKQETEALLPRGLETPDNHFFAIVDSQSVAVGMLWFAVKTKFNARIAYVYDVSVQHDRQRQGHAMRAFLALEDEVRSRGLAGIALHVFGHNAGARALYAQLGYAPTNINLFKPLTRAGS
jgi:ribosomal protein S18 acetylase RimI-like enzyme